MPDPIHTVRFRSSRIEPAAPSFADFGEAGRVHYLGLTKREWYAGMALSSYMVATNLLEGVNKKAVARECFEVADAMCAEAGVEDV